MMYSALAPLYDRIMSHVNYTLWLDLIKKITERYFPGGAPAILELGGGTGTLGAMLLKQGYSCCSSDVSFAMCRQARRKGIPVFCADARHIPVRKVFSLIIFLYDGINYLQSLDEYRSLFGEVYTHLVPEGYFLFDITTEANSEQNFVDMMDAEDFGESSYLRHSYYDRKTKIQYNDFTIYAKSAAPGALYEKYGELHDQKIFTVDEILSVLPHDRFSVTGIWDNFSTKKYSARSERIHFLVQKRALP